MAAVVLEDSVSLRVIAVNGNVEDVSLSPMTAPRVMDVNAPLLCLPLEPFDCNEATSLIRIEGSLVGWSRHPDTVVGAIDLGPPTTASTCMPNRVARLGESRLAIPTSVVLRNLREVSDQKSMPIVKTHCQNWPADFFIVGREVGQDEVPVGLHRVSRNALFEVLFKQRQVLVGQTVTQAWTLGKEGFLKFSGFTHVVSYMGTPMNGDAAKEATIVPIGVQRQNSAFVAKPIRKMPTPEEQRMAI